MTKETIAVDIDEVLFPMAPTFLEFHNNVHGTSFTLDHMTSYYVEELTGETAEVMTSKIEAYLDTQHYSAGEPIAGSVEAIHKLREKFSLVLVTSRHAAYRGSTETFIQAHFDGLFDSLYYTHTLESPELTVPKHTICKELGAIALVDDSLHNIKDVAAHGVQGILFGNYAWNITDQMPANTVRAKDWLAVLEHFNAT